MTLPVSSQPGPCDWPFSTDCAPGWAAIDPAVQVFAEGFAKFLLWASTGRRYGLCPVVVRPCQWQRCSRTGFPPGGWWSGGPAWVPQLVEGVWINSCGCAVGDTCSCEMPCTVRLPGPVAAITEVRVDGAAVAADAYQVYEWSDLVRVDGECWPLCQDWNADPATDPDTFQVSYNRGSEPPAGADCVTGLLAAELAKACTGAPCRLPRMVQSVARQGVNVSFLTPEQLISMRMTGIIEVDMWVTADNPDRLTSDSVVWSPEIARKRGRRRTW